MFKRELKYSETPSVIKDALVILVRGRQGVSDYEWKKGV